MVPALTTLALGLLDGRSKGIVPSR